MSADLRTRPSQANAMIKDKIAENATLKWQKSRKIAGKVEIVVPGRRFETVAATVVATG